MVIVSGRPSYAMRLTKAWLAEHGVRWNVIALRPRGDIVPGVAHKLRVLAALRDLNLAPELAIDDSAAVRQAFMAEAIACRGAAPSGVAVGVQGEAGGLAEGVDG
jgi:hypothetical protein